MNKMNISERVRLRNDIMTLVRKKALEKFNAGNEWTARDEARMWREMFIMLADEFICSKQIINH